MASRVLKTARTLGVRVYAVAVLLVVLWTGYAAGGYLIQTVFYPIQIPEEFVDRPTQLNVDTLHQQASAGLPSSEARTPIAHYHAVDRWFRPDPREGCSSSGCHDPLPHRLHRETRAFANFHATFLTCAMCHASPDVNPLPTMWINLATGNRQDPPALMQLLRHLEQGENPIANDEEEFHRKIIDLLRQSLATAGNDPSLEYLLVEIDTSEPGSPVWQHAVNRLPEELPGHARGEYGAKLTPQETATDQRIRVRKLADLTTAYHATATDSRERRDLLDRIHDSVVSKPNGCLLCHGSDPSRLDFEGLGYAPDRAAFLRHIPVARQMESIRQGRPFHLPRFLEP